MKQLGEISSYYTPPFMSQFKVSQVRKKEKVRFYLTPTSVMNLRRALLLFLL